MSEKLTRRDALGLLGATAGVGLVSTLREDVLRPSVAPQATRIAFERGAVIRTLLNDVPPDRVDGPVLFHEHLSLRYPLTKALAEQQGRPVPATFSDDVDLLIDETKAAATDGVRCIVDGGHADMDRDLAALRRIAAASGVHIVGSGGFYMQRTYPPDIATKSADQIADDLVAEAKAQRLGAFGEIGQEGGVLTADERKVFTAVAKAHARSRLPIFTHNAYTGARPAAMPVPMDAALRQLDVLEAGGANPRRVAIGHVCCLDDVKAEIPKQLAKRGVFVGFDRVTIPIVPDSQKVTTILAFLDAGYVDQLLLSSDFYSARGLKKNGGPGIAQTVTVFGPMLLKAGVSEATLRHILVDNSRRFLAFVPTSA
jgi:phosphotriesterase-related protein